MLITLMKKILNSDNIIVLLLLCMGFSLFVFNESLRTMLNQGKINTYYNLLFIACGLLTIAVLMLRQLIDIGIVLLTTAFLGGAIMTVIYGEQHSFQTSIIPSMIMPFLIVGFRLPGEIFEPFFEKFVIGFNFLGLMLVANGVCDYLSGAAIQVFLAQHHIFNNDQAQLVLLERSFGIYRFYSVLGHPLVNAWYLLTFYTLNSIYSRYFRRLLNEYLLISVTLIGLLLSGSRTALIIGLVMFLFLNNIENKAPFILLFSAMTTGLAMSPLFQNNLMRRFVTGVSSGDFSEGRNEAVNRVFHGYVQQPDFFLGGGVSYSRQITMNMGGLINSFEYPIMMFAYDFGILGAIMIYTFVLIVPTFLLLKNRTYFLLFNFIALSCYINGFNSLANYTDEMGQLCFFIMIMLNLSYFIKRKREASLEAVIINDSWREKGCV